MNGSATKRARYLPRFTAIPQRRAVRHLQHIRHMAGCGCIGIETGFILTISITSVIEYPASVQPPPQAPDKSVHGGYPVSRQAGPSMLQYHIQRDVVPASEIVASNLVSIPELFASTASNVSPGGPHPAHRGCGYANFHLPEAAWGSPVPAGFQASIPAHKDHKCLSLLCRMLRVNPALH